MKKQLCFLVAALVLLLSACGGAGASSDQSGTSVPSSAAASHSGISAVGGESAANSGTGALSAEDLPIDISYVSYEDNAGTSYVRQQHGAYSFEIPADWQVLDGTDQGLVNGLFIVPPGTDMDNFRYSAHVALELNDSPPYGDNVPDFSSEAIQKDYFAYQLITIYSKMGGLSNLEFLVWESLGGHVYIEQFMRSNETLRMYQTSYNVMNPDRNLVVYAAHFDDDTTPGVNQVARHLVNTFQRD